MNGSQRIASLLSGKLPDRIPICFNLLDQGAAELDMDIQTFYSNGRNVAKGRLALQKKYDLDIIWSFFHSASEVQLLGCQHLIYSLIGPPNVGHMVIKTSQDIDELRIPTSFDNHPVFIEQKKCIDTIKATVNGDYPVASAVIGSFSLPSLLMGTEKWMDLLWNGPASTCNRLLEKCSVFTQQRISELRRAGVDIIAYINPFASLVFLTVGQFEEMALPWINKDILPQGPNGIVYFNGGGQINHTLRAIQSSVGISIYQINPFDDPVVAREQLGPSSLIVSSINDIKLMSWPDEDVYREVKLLIDKCANGGAYMFGTLMMPCLIPEHKLHVLRDAVEKYGHYNVS